MEISLREEEAELGSRKSGRNKEKSKQFPARVHGGFLERSEPRKASHVGEFSWVTRRREVGRIRKLW